MSNEDIRWGSLGGLKEDPPSRIKDFGYTTSTGTAEGTSEAPILQWCNWQFAKTYETIKDLTDLVNAGGGNNNGGGDNGGGDNTGGTGGINLIVNGDFAGGSTNWAFTGTTSEFTQVEDDASLSGYIATWQPTDNLSQMYYTGATEIPIDLQNMVGLIEFDFKATSSNFTVEIYSATALLASHDIKQVSEWYHFRGQVPFDLAGQSVIVRFKCPTQASGDILTLNNVRVGNPYNAGQSAIVGGWKPSETTFGNVTNPPQFQERRVGENLELMIPLGGYTATDEVYIDLESGLTALFSDTNMGRLIIYSSATTVGSGSVVFNSSYPNNSKVWIHSKNATDSTVWSTGIQYVAGILSIPIQEWKGQGTLDALESDRYSEDPAGGIMAYVGSELPFGWLECDGTEYLQGDYPELYTAIGDTYNTSKYIDDAGGTHTYTAPTADHFRVPNLKNLYLRGDGTSAVADFLEDTTAVNGLTAADLGHTHGRPDSFDNYLGRNQGNPAAGWQGTPNAIALSPTTGEGKANITLSGDAETRPTTGVVRYIIRAFSSKGPSMGLPLATDEQYGLVKLSDLPSGGGDGGSSTFEDLTDTPDNYTGAGDKIVSVKADESGLEFIDAPTGGGVATFSELTDTPISYTDASGKMVVVNGAEDGLEYVEAPTDVDLSEYVKKGEAESVGDEMLKTVVEAEDAGGLKGEYSAGSMDKSADESAAALANKKCYLVAVNTTEFVYSSSPNVADVDTSKIPIKEVKVKWDLENGDPLSDMLQGLPFVYVNLKLTSGVLIRAALDLYQHAPIGTAYDWLETVCAADKTKIALLDLSSFNMNSMQKKEVDGEWEPLEGGLTSDMVVEIDLDVDSDPDYALFKGYDVTFDSAYEIPPVAEAYAGIQPDKIDVDSLAEALPSSEGVIEDDSIENDKLKTVTTGESILSPLPVSNPADSGIADEDILYMRANYYFYENPSTDEYEYFITVGALTAADSSNDNSSPVENQKVDYVKGDEFEFNVDYWDDDLDEVNNMPENKKRITVIADDPNVDNPSRITVASVFYTATGEDAMDDLYSALRGKPNRSIGDGAVCVTASPFEFKIPVEDFSKACGIVVQGEEYKGIQPNKIDVDALAEALPSSGGDAVDLSEYVKKGEADSVDNIMLKTTTDSFLGGGVETPFDIQLVNPPAGLTDVKYYAEYIPEKRWGGTNTDAVVVIKAVGMDGGSLVDVDVSFDYEGDEPVQMDFTSLVSTSPEVPSADTLILYGKRKHPSLQPQTDHFWLWYAYPVDENGEVDESIYPEVYDFSGELGNRDNPLTLEEFNKSFGYYGEVEIQGYDGIQPDKIDVDALAEALPSSGGGTIDLESAQYGTFKMDSADRFDLVSGEFMPLPFTVTAISSFKDVLLENGSFKFTENTAGTYEFGAFVSVVLNDRNVNDYYQIAYYKNEEQLCNFAVMRASNSSDNAAGNTAGTYIAEFEAGDVLSVRCKTFSTVAAAINIYAATISINQVDAPIVIGSTSGGDNPIVKNKFQTKTLDSKFSSAVDTSPIGDLIFNGLVNGKWYTAKLSCSMYIPANKAISISFYTGSKRLSFHTDFRTNGTATNWYQSRYYEITFKAEASQCYPACGTGSDGQLGTDSWLIASDGLYRTYMTLEERNDLAETTDFT